MFKIKLPAHLKDKTPAELFHDGVPLFQNQKVIPDDWTPPDPPAPTPAEPEPEAQAVVLPSVPPPQAEKSSKPKGGCGSCRAKALLQKAAKGAAGLTKAALRLDQAEPAVIASRRGICGECPRKKITALGDQCGVCGCLITPKTTLASEVCPEGKWDQSPNN